MSSAQRFSGFSRGMTLLTPQHDPALRKLIQEAWVTRSAGGGVRVA